MEGRVKPAVLIVDDDAQLRRALDRLLRSTFRVTAAASGAEALSRLASGDDFEAILCDLNMADMDGVQLFTELERRRVELSSRVIFLSGGGINPAQHAFLSTTANPVLEKPVGRQELFDALHGLIVRSASNVD